MKRSLVEDADLATAYRYEVTRYWICQRCHLWEQSAHAQDAAEHYRARLRGLGVEMPEVD